MKYIKWVFAPILALILISPQYLLSASGEEMVEVRISFSGLPLRDLCLKMDRAGAEEMFREMEKAAEEGGLSSLFSLLEKYTGNKNFDPSFLNANITNYLSFVFGFADGLFVYTADIAFFLFLSLFLNDPISILVLVAFFVAFTHILPFRFVVPVGIANVVEGKITTIGMNGVKSIENETLLLGFVGVVVSIFIPSSKITFLPLFIAGYSLAVLPSPFG